MVLSSCSMVQTDKIKFTLKNVIWVENTTLTLYQRKCYFKVEDATSKLKMLLELKAEGTA